METDEIIDILDRYTLNEDDQIEPIHIPFERKIDMKNILKNIYFGQVWSSYMQKLNRDRYFKNKVCIRILCSIK